MISFLSIEENNYSLQKQRIEHEFYATDCMLGGGWLGRAMELGKFPVPKRPTTLTFSRTGAYCTCSRCGTGGLFVCFIFSCRLSYLPFLMPHLLGESWTY